MPQEYVEALCFTKLAYKSISTPFTLISHSPYSSLYFTPFHSHFNSHAFPFPFFSYKFHLHTLPGHLRTYRSVSIMLILSIYKYLLNSTPMHSFILPFHLYMFLSSHPCNIFLPSIYTFSSSFPILLYLLFFFLPSDDCLIISGICIH